MTAPSIVTPRSSSAARRAIAAYRAGSRAASWNERPRERDGTWPVNTSSSAASPRRNDRRRSTCRPETVTERFVNWKNGKSGTTRMRAMLPVDPGVTCTSMMLSLKTSALAGLP